MGALYKYITREGGELFKLKDAAGVRTDGDRLAVNTLRLEMRAGFFSSKQQSLRQSPRGARGLENIAGRSSSCWHGARVRCSGAKPGSLQGLDNHGSAVLAALQWPRLRLAAKKSTRHSPHLALLAQGDGDGVTLPVGCGFSLNCRWLGKGWPGNGGSELIPSFPGIFQLPALRPCTQPEVGRATEALRGCELSEW